MKHNDKILIIGGGFAGARVAQDLAAGGFTDVTLVDRKDYFEVTYSTLRTLMTPEMGTRARMKYDALMGCKFHLGVARELREGEVVLEGGDVLAFDHAIVATGSSYSGFPVAKSSAAMSIEARAQEFSAEHDRLSSAQNVLIIGGGPVGVELAGEIADHFPEKSVTIAQAAGRLVDTLAAKASRLAKDHLEALGVTVLLNTRLSDADDIYKAADVVYVCVGQHANTDLMRAHFADRLTERGLIKVDATLRMDGSDTIYALGDCSTAPGLKLGYLADAQAALLAKNLIAALKGKPPKPYKKAPDMALVPIGRRKGFVQLPFGVTTFRPLANMKQKDMFIARVYGNLGVKR